MLIYENFALQAKLTPKKVCLVYAQHQITWQELVSTIDQTALALTSQIKKGDRILISLNNPLTMLIMFYAVIQAGGIATLMDAQTNLEVTQKISKIYAYRLIIDDKYRLPSQKGQPLPQVDPQNIFMGALTSGTSGLPKVIDRDHQSWSLSFPYQSSLFHLSSQDRLLIVGTLAYTANLNACVHLLAIGGTVVFSESRQPQKWYFEIKKHAISALFMVPTNYRLLCKIKNKAIITTVTSLVSGGAKINLTDLKKLMQLFPNANFTEYYGASELGYVTYANANDLKNKPNSVGKPFPQVTLSFNDQLIFVKSPFLAKHFQPTTSIGDLGTIDSDGYIYLLGRQNGLINSGGIKILPEELEKALITYLQISNVSVIGLPDALRGEIVCICLEIASNTHLNKQHLLEFCRNKMNLRHCALRIYRFKQLPLNINDKVDKQLLRIILKEKRSIND
ncbi:MAG TPA: AMP-binding protein [Candidatus Avacidaminococcus intestinavium]|uniref:AMP-binding protein n=1 Tax=Candidatus Avacidaminococcus intestinavium TaxID=2840684 RepID=A0A9D1SM76_9FIRM|nr:AMP-binding protein [Candidatus Avacidaminococcus intestinavium]